MLDDEDDAPENADPKSLADLDATPRPSRDFVDFYDGLLKLFFIVVAFIIFLALVSAELS